MPRPARKTPPKKAGATAVPPRAKVGSASKSSNKAKPHGTVKSSQSERMKAINSDSENDKQGSPVKRARRGFIPTPPVETQSSSVEASSSTVCPNSTSSSVYLNIETAPAVSTEEDNPTKHTKCRDTSPVASHHGETLIESVKDQKVALAAVSPPESPLPSLPDGSSNPNETSAQKKLRKDRWNRMLEAELPFLIAEARTELAMQKILQDAREMEEALVKAMEEESGKKESQTSVSMQKLREANDRFDKQFHMDQESDLVDI